MNATLPYRPDSMPIASSLSLVILAAAGVPIAAATAVFSPASEAFTLTGTAFAAFLIVAYIRMKQPHVGFWPLAFNVVAAASAGYLLPEPLLRNVFGYTGDLVPKAWGVMGMVCGLAGGSLITAVIVAASKRAPRLVNAAADRIGFIEPESATDQRSAGK